MRTTHPSWVWPRSGSTTWFPSWGRYTSGVLSTIPRTSGFAWALSGRGSLNCRGNFRPVRETVWHPAKPGGDAAALRRATRRHSWTFARCLDSLEGTWGVRPDPRRPGAGDRWRERHHRRRPSPRRDRGPPRRRVPHRRQDRPQWRGEAGAGVRALNLNRRHLNRDQKRHLVAESLTGRP